MDWAGTSEVIQASKRSRRLAIVRKPDARELPARTRRKEISIRQAFVTWVEQEIVELRNRIPQLDIPFPNQLRSAPLDVNGNPRWQ